MDDFQAVDGPVPLRDVVIDVKGEIGRVLARDLDQEDLLVGRLW